MTKLEQVIKALQLCRYDPDPGQECKFLVSCDICPYWKDEFGCREIDLFNDALELLKEREAVKPKEVNMYPTGQYACGFCGHISVGSKDYHAKYCPECGRAVKWE